MSDTRKAPVCLPGVFGLNVMLMVQLPPAATELPQSLLSLKLADAPILVMRSDAVPVFDSVTAWGALVVPTTTLPKSRLVVESRTVAAPPPAPPLDDTPLPASVSVCDPAPSYAVTVPVCGPVKVGVKATVIAQLPPAGMDWPTAGQVPPVEAKAKGPVIVKGWVIVTAELLLL